MKKLFENSIYWIGVLTLGVIVGMTIKMVSAWVEPDQMPPGGNIAAPLNTSNLGQSKQGGLTLNIGGATYGLIVEKGFVGIGTTTPEEKLEVDGNIKLGGSSPNYKITNVAAPVNNSDVATKNYVDALSDFRLDRLIQSCQFVQGPDGIQSCDAVCPQGYLAVTGGYAYGTANNSLSTEEFSRPSDTGWSCGLRSDTIGGGCYAVCLGILN